jgi:hypothetical protein
MEKRRVGGSDRRSRGEADLENHGANAFFIARIPFKTGPCLSIKKNLFPL